MNTENIEVGMVVKNYKELCTLLGEKVTEGNSRKSQIDEWERYFDYTRQGHKYIINEIYPMPLPKDFSKNDVYTKYVQVILTKYLRDTNDRYFTTTKLLKLLGFVNDNWGDIGLLADFVKTHNCTYQQAKYYYNQLYQHIMSYCVTAFKRCLGRLSQRKYITYKEIYVNDCNGKIRELTNKEQQLYTDISFELKQEMGIKLINIYNAKEYYNKLNERLNEVGLDKVYKTFRIFPAVSGIEEAVEVSKQEYINAKKEVNGKSLTQMKNYIDIDIESCVAKITDEVNKAFDNSDEDYSHLPNVREDVIKNELDKIGVDYMKDNKTDLTNMYIELFI